MVKRVNTPEATGLLKELQDIKRLMILGLLRSGAKQEQIAAALGISQSSISRMLPGKLGRIGK